MSLKKLKKQKGFTLVELMIVVAIIGILAAVAIPKFADLVTKSKEASVKGTLGALRSAVSIYYSDTEGEFPANLFVGLTLNNKYMPAVGGVPSLGRYQLPRNKSATASPGHRTSEFVLLDSVAGVRQDGILSVLDTGTGTTEAIVYSTGASTEGDLVINCTHTDTKDTVWTMY